MTKTKPIITNNPANGKTNNPKVNPISKHDTITAVKSKFAPTIFGIYLQAVFSEVDKS